MCMALNMKMRVVGRKFMNIEISSAYFRKKSLKKMKTESGIRAMLKLKNFRIGDKSSLIVFWGCV